MKSAADAPSGSSSAVTELTYSGMTPPVCSLWILYSRWGPTIPSILVLVIMLFLGGLHLIADLLGHTTVRVKTSSVSGEVERNFHFLFPPISLTGNRVPEYFVYAFGGLTIALTLFLYMEWLRRAISYAYSCPRSQDAGIEAAESDYEDEEHTPNHYRVAFWRDHIRLSRGTELPIDRLVTVKRSQRPSSYILKCLTVLLYLSLVFFAFQAVVPPQPDILQELAQDCRLLSDMAQNVSLVSPVKRDIPARRLGDSMERRDIVGRVSQRWMQRVYPEVMGSSPSRHIVVSAADLSLNGNLIYCESLGYSRPAWNTLVHAMTAMLFFLLSQTVMVLFVLWLFYIFISTRRTTSAGTKKATFSPSLLSIILKSLLAIIPFLRLTFWIKSDILRHFSLVDWVGITQRLSVICLLLYMATTGVEISIVRRSCVLPA